MAPTFATNKQLPDHAILDHFNKQTYLGNRFGYVYAFSSSGTGETNLILLSNPAVSASSFPSNYQGLFLDLKKLACLTASDTAVLRFYLNPTVTGDGTSKTPIQLRPSNPNISIASLSVAPTTSSNGDLIAVLCASAFNSNSDDLLTVLDPGQSLLVTIQTSASSASIAATLAWSEI